MTQENRDYLGGIFLLAGLIVLLAYSGEVHLAMHVRGIAVAGCSVAVGLCVVINRVQAIAACLGVIAVRLFIAYALKPDGRILVIAAGSLALAALLMWVAHRRTVQR